MSLPEDFLKAGSPAQQQAIAGIAFGHAFEKHGHELPADSEREFGASAYHDLNNADQVLEFSQDGGPALLFSNHSSGMVGWINTSNPEKSTYFRPEFGIDDYVEEKIIFENLTRDLTLEVPSINEKIPMENFSDHNLTDELDIDPRHETDSTRESIEVDGIGFELDSADDEHER